MTSASTTPVCASQQFRLSPNATCCTFTTAVICRKSTRLVADRRVHEYALLGRIDARANGGEQHLLVVKCGEVRCADMHVAPMCGSWRPTPTVRRAGRAGRVGRRRARSVPAQ